MDKEQVLQMMVETLQKNPEIELTLDDLEISFREMGLNSLQYVQMLVFLEGIFDIEFDDECLNMDTLYNINKLIDYIVEATN